MSPNSQMSEPVRARIEHEVAQLYDQHAHNLLKYAASFSRGHDPASDAVQEAFLRYFIERSYGREIKNPRAWLYQVLRNYLTDRITSASSKREVAAEHIDQVASTGHNPEMLVERSQTAQEIAASLSGRELECLRLRTEGLSYEEIGFAMEVRTGTVGALLARAHDKIRKRAERGGGPDLDLAAAVCYLAQV